MRLVTWNSCIGGFRIKCDSISSLDPRPDVLVAQEVEPLSKVSKFAGDSQPTCRYWVADPTSPKRGVAVLSYTGVKIEPVDTRDPMAFSRYYVSHDDVRFQLVGVWTFRTKSTKTAYMQAHEGLRVNADWIRRAPTVILGDFNNNRTFKYGRWNELIELMESVGLVSAYHVLSNEEHGQEQQPTHYHHRKREKAFHLDYCFVPRAWVPHIQAVQVGSFEDWRGLSDHVPLVVDVSLPSAQ